MPDSSYITRTMESVVRRAAREFPALVLTGPRQSGKTTLLRHVFGAKSGYVSLETPDVRLAAQSDPRGFLDAYPPPVIFDEIQYAPDLLMYIKERIDEQRNVPGQYLLTGSQNLLMAEQVAESLAGRAATLRLLPLSYREINGIRDAKLPWERAAQSRRRMAADSARLSGDDLWRSFLRGSFPELVTQPKRDPSLWHASYVQTYLERDVRNLRHVGDLTLFQSFLRMIAARSGQLLNLSDVGRDLGVSLNTAKAWLSVLEATYQIVILRPYHANIGKRLVKSPKIYFTDLGTLCHLSGLQDPGHAKQGPLAGAIMETAILSEVFKTLVHRGEQAPLYFWRTSAGSEVDIIVETEGQLVPIEVKLSETPNPNTAKGIVSFQEALGDRATSGYVVHPGEIRLPLGPKVTAIPFAEL